MTCPYSSSGTTLRTNYNSLKGIQVRALSFVANLVHKELIEEEIRGQSISGALIEIEVDNVVVGVVVAVNHFVAKVDYLP